MKFSNKFFIIFISFFFYIIQVNSSEPIAYIDMDFIIKNSEIGKKTLNLINIQNNKNINELKKKEKILKDLESGIISKKNLLSKENFDREVLLFREKSKKFKEDKLNMVENLNEYK